MPSFGTFLPSRQPVTNHGNYRQSGNGHPSRSTSGSYIALRRGRMMSPGRGWDDRLREQSDSEDERNAPNPSPSLLPAANNNTAVGSGGIHHRSTSTAAAPPPAAAPAEAAAAAAAAAASHHHRSSFFGRNAPQDLPAIDSLAQESAAPQHNTGVPLAARAAGNKGRMSLHGR